MASTVVGEAVYEVKIDQGNWLFSFNSQIRLLERLGDTAEIS